MCICVSEGVSVDVCVDICVCVYACESVCLYVYACVYVCVCVGGEHKTPIEYWTSSPCWINHLHSVFRCHRRDGKHVGGCVNSFPVRKSSTCRVKEE